MRSLLERTGTGFVVNGQLAWEAVQESRPDLIATDLRMPAQRLSIGRADA